MRCMLILRRAIVYLALPLSQRSLRQLTLPRTASHAAFSLQTLAELSLLLISWRPAFVRCHYSQLHVGVSYACANPLYFFAKGCLPFVGHTHKQSGIGGEHGQCALDTFVVMIATHNGRKSARSVHVSLKLPCIILRVYEVKVSTRCDCGARDIDGETNSTGSGSCLFTHFSDLWWVHRRCK